MKSGLQSNLRALESKHRLDGIYSCENTEQEQMENGDVETLSPGGWGDEEEPVK